MLDNEVYLRCAQLANASRVLGNLGDDILSKITLKSGPKRKPKPPVETTPVEAPPPAEAPAEPEAPQLTREQQRALRMLERQSAYDRLTTGASVRTYPSYNLQPLLLKRYRELEEARAFNNWLGERRQAQEGQRHLDDVSRLTEAVRRQVPQLRYARAERRGVERAAGEVAQQ